MNFINQIFSYATLLVALAAAMDICANILLAASRGFRRLFLGYMALFLVGGAFYCLSLAVRHMDLAVAYAMWGSFGILGTSLGGWALFGQRLKPLAFVGMGLLIAGMVLLHF